MLIQLVAKIQNSRFQSLLAWKRLCNFINLHLAIKNSIRTRSYVRFWRILHIKNNLSKKRSKISVPNSFFPQKEPQFFNLFLHFCNNFYQRQTISLQILPLNFDILK
eukprot:UN05372